MQRRTGTARIRVSIHAPVKGATVRRHPVQSHHRSFNPRTRKGCDITAMGDASTVEVSIHAPVKGATAPLSGPINRAFQRHFARTSFFSPENKGGFPNIFYFTCIFNRLAIRASHGGKSVHLGCPHRQTGRWIRGQDVRRGARRPEPFRSDPSFAGFSLLRAVAGVQGCSRKVSSLHLSGRPCVFLFGPGMGVSVLQWLAAGKGRRR